MPNNQNTPAPADIHCYRIRGPIEDRISKSDARTFLENIAAKAARLRAGSGKGIVSDYPANYGPLLVAASEQGATEEPSSYCPHCLLLAFEMVADLGFRCDSEVIGNNSAELQERFLTYLSDHDARLLRVLETLAWCVEFDDETIAFLSARSLLEDVSATEFEQLVRRHNSQFLAAPDYPGAYCLEPHLQGALVARQLKSADKSASARKVVETLLGRQYELSRLSIPPSWYWGKFSEHRRGVAVLLKAAEARLLDAATIARWIENFTSGYGEIRYCSLWERLAVELWSAWKVLGAIFGPQDPNTLCVLSLQARLPADHWEGPCKAILPDEATRDLVIQTQASSDAANLRNLALFACKIGDRKAAQELCSSSIAAIEKMLGPDALLTLESVFSLAELLSHSDQEDDSLPLYRRVLAGFDRIHGAENPKTIAVVWALAGALASSSRCEEIQPYISRLMEAVQRGYKEVSASDIRRLQKQASEHAKETSGGASSKEGGKLTLKGKLTYFVTQNSQLFSKQTRGLSLGQIHLDLEIPRLASTGIHNVGQLLDRLEQGLPPVKTLGNKSLQNIVQSLSALDQACTPDGSIDWVSYASLTGFPLIPSPDQPMNSGLNFLGSLPAVLVELAAKCLNPIEGDILLHRLAASDSASLTLEQLGKKHKLLSERIRQIEEELLTKLSDALLYGNYTSLRIHFSPQFATFWQLAAKKFGTNVPDTFPDFMSQLRSAWDVDDEQIIPNLPFIYSILTKQAVLPKGFKTVVVVPAPLRRLTNQPVLNQSVVNLHPSCPLFTLLEKRGVQTIGDLIGVASTGSLNLEGYYREKTGEIESILKSLSRVVNESSPNVGDQYAQDRGFPLVPQSDPLSSAQFLASVLDVVRTVIQGADLGSRAEIIFEHRILPEARKRKTLEQVAQLTDSHHGSTIKREETELLRRLNRIFSEGNYVGLRMRVRSSFLQFWAGATKEHAQAHDTGDFCYRLSKHWDLPYEAVAKVVPLMGAIISGRPVR